MERKRTAVVAKVAEEVALAKMTGREEQAIRMLYGKTLERTAVLPQVAQAHSELADELLVVEMSLLRAIKRRATVSQPRKAKIVASLKSKGS